MQIERITPHNIAWRMDWAWQFVSRGQFPQFRAPFWFNTELGRFKCPDVYGPMQFRRGWEKQTVEIVSNLKHGYFVDVGANLGIYSIIAARNGNKVLSIEANPSVYRCLLQTTNVNSLTERIRAVNCAAWSEPTTLRFETTRDTSVGHILTTRADDNGDVVSIRGERLDDLIGEKPSLVKIDIEGAEPDALAGASKLIQCHVPIIFESNHQDHFTKCAAMLKDYQMTKLDERNWYAR